MSLLSQFFPSGGSGTKVDFLLVGGGGGGGASGGTAQCACQSVGGGGGGGMVVLGEDYEVVPGRTYPIVIGAGGAGGGFYYTPSLQTQNYKMGGSLRGANGGDSFFGSVRAIGGGGGGAGNNKADTCNYVCTELSNNGKIGGNGGGAGSRCNVSFQVGTTSSGNSIGAFPVGNTIKFGSPGSSSPSTYPACWKQLGQYANCLYNSSGGGGGSGLGGGSFTGGSLTLTTPFDGNNGPCILNSYTPVKCGTYDCSTTYIPNQWSGTLGGSAYDNSYEQFRVTDATNILAGKDGYLSNISGSDEYYGGGGAVAYTISTGDQYALGLVMAPNHPCYPVQSSCAHKVCPYGGLGGGTYFASNKACGAQPYYLSSLGFCYLGVTYGCSISPLGRAICGGAAGTGGGGGAHMLSPSTPTGPVYPDTANSCAYCGTNGASGSLIIRYPTAFAAATVTGNTPTPAQPGYRVYKWTGPGTITFA